jgi:hypothetical protein
MKRIVAFLFAALFAAVLCGPAFALDENAGPAGATDGKSQARKPAAKRKPARDAKKKKMMKKKTSKRAGKARSKKKASTKNPPKAPVRPKEPTAAEKAGTVSNDGPGPFSTPPPGTGYGSLEPESLPPPAPR